MNKYNVDDNSEFIRLKYLVKILIFLTSAIFIHIKLDKAKKKLSELRIALLFKIQ